MRTMEHKEYLDAVLRGSDATIIEAVRLNYYDDLLDILNRFERSYPASIDCNIGWFPLIAQTHRKLRHLDPGYCVAQIKEKFGGLRYYYTPSEHLINSPSIVTSIMHDVMIAAENKSFHTCEICSKPGAKSSKNSWIRTVCPEHDK